MKKIIVIDNSPRDADRLASLLEAAYGTKVEICVNGSQAEAVITTDPEQIAAVFVLNEIPGPPFAFELLLLSRKVLTDDVPLIVVSSSLDASLATRAFALGARDFLEKPLDLERVKSSLERLLFAHHPELPTVKSLNQTILGDSAALHATLKQVAKVISHPETRVLLIGESGTGKELLAQGIHQLGTHSNEPCVAVNIGAIPRELIESQLFGHEKGAFTSAVDSHRGYLEEAGSGTLFLDEIGDLDLALQVKLLRVVQERKFRRLKGNKDLEFHARLICATNRDLAKSVREGLFRRDLFHRIAEVTVYVPPLRERRGDVDLLLDHFLGLAAGGRPVRFARETLTILRSYPFPGNIRELENLVRAALIDCEGEWLLPHHLPLNSMGVFLVNEGHDSSDGTGHDGPPQVGVAAAGLASSLPSLSKLFTELQSLLPANWLELPYKEMLDAYHRAFDRVYLPSLINRHRHNVTQATRAAGFDKKTFDKHWKEAGLKPLRSGEENPND